MLNAQNPFICVNGTHFELHGKPYYFLGANFWYGMNLGVPQPAARERLQRELDRLHELGITNLRILAGSEGPDDAPWRLVPTLQPTPGTYNEHLLQGLDFLLAEMEKRNMHAVVCLTNFWPWSGGMAQYLQWVHQKPIPYPPPAEGGDWASYQLFTAKFFKQAEARQAFENHIRFLLQRTNSLTRRPYIEDPTIMAWELANEPRGIIHAVAMQGWIEETAALIKSLDPNHLVTVGSEGRTPSRLAGNVFRKDHQSPHIDYTTIHIWAQNRGWYDPETPQESLEKAKKRTQKYLRRHLRWAEKLNKPLVVEEFGFSRDQNSHDPASPTSLRDQYYRFIFDEVYRRAVSGSALVGCNFWAWGGEGRPSTPKAIWQAGDDFIGDPPHEYQGWYSVFDHDQSTLDTIRAYARKMNKLTE